MEIWKTRFKLHTRLSLCIVSCVRSRGKTSQLVNEPERERQIRHTPNLWFYILTAFIRRKHGRLLAYRFIYKICSMSPLQCIDWYNWWYLGRLDEKNASELRTKIVVLVKHHEVVRRSRISNDFPAGRFLVCHSAIHIFSKPQQQSIIRQTLSNHNKADNVKSKKKVGIKRNLLLLILAVLLVVRTLVSVFCDHDLLIKNRRILQGLRSLQAAIFKIGESDPRHPVGFHSW